MQYQVPWTTIYPRQNDDQSVFSSSGSVQQNMEFMWELL